MRQEQFLRELLIWCCPVLYMWVAVSSHAEVIHYIPLDGATPVDVVGGATVTNFGAVPTTDRNGMESSAYEFNGSTDYIYADINVNADVISNLTWGAWIQSDISHQASTVSVRSIASQDNGSFDRQFGIDYRSGNGISAFTGDGVLGSYAQDEGTWYFVATTYSETAHEIKLYIAEQGDVSPEDFTVIAGSLVNVDDGHDYIYLGENPFEFVDEHWDGAIDNFFIFNEVLNLEELSGIATNGVVIPEPTTLLLLAVGVLTLRRRGKR